MKNKKVLLGMSGGVDSCTSALLLKQQGYDVIGITLELFAGSSCCNTQTYIDAKNVCNQIGIPHIILNLKDEFRCKVIDNFIEEYSNQRTPNPCIECNRYMKFGLMWEKAKELGCDYIATGHYAKMEYSDKYQSYAIKKSNNIAKDQSYVLYNMPKALLGKMLFPLGEFESKDQVRAIAKEANLKVANKPDSEDICFVPDGNYKKFLENNSDLKPKEGNIVLSDGQVVGKHNGLYGYTIGQRRGLGISYKYPLFVTGFNSDKNELIVGPEAELYKKEFEVNDINLMLIDESNLPMQVEVKTRYSAKVAKATIKKAENQTDRLATRPESSVATPKGTPNSGEGTIKVVLDEPQRAITPGQSAVFYDGDIVLGGGKIL